MLTLVLLTHYALSLDVPTFISFQGKLSNFSSGEAYSTASLRINVTNESNTDQVVWGPYDFDDVTDSQGVFDIVLGKTNELNLTPGWQYQVVVEVDLDSATFSSADLTFGDLSPAGDSILITGGGPANAGQLLMEDNTTTVQSAIESASGSSVGWTDVGSVLDLNDSVATAVNITQLLLGPSSADAGVGGLNMSGNLFVYGQNNYLMHGDFADCGKLYTVSGKITCGTDSSGGGSSAAWIDMGSYLTLNSSVASYLNVSGQVVVGDASADGGAGSVNMSGTLYTGGGQIYWDSGSSQLVIEVN